MEPAFKCYLYTQWDSVTETNFSFASGYQLEIASGLGMDGAYV